MDMLESMLKRVDWPSIALLLTLSLFGLASFYPLYSMWGINHLSFLTDGFTYAFWAILAALLVILLAPISLTSLDRVLNRIAGFIWEKGFWPKLLIVTVFVSAFIIFRAKSHFLGDGYTLLSIFGQGESFIRRWAEPGSIFIIRKLQWLLGGYTRQTTLWTCQILSIISGAVVVLNFIAIASRISNGAKGRLVALTSLLFSGVMLIFFGYVEHYPLLWALATTFVRFGLDYLEHNRRSWTVFLLFVLAVLMHLQAIFLLPGVAYLVVIKFSRPMSIFSLNPRKLLVIGGVTLTGVLFVTWLLKNQINLATVFLPILHGPPQAPDYALFSIKHALDMLNQILVMFPGILVVTAFLIRGKPRQSKDSTTMFLGLLSVGSLLFLLLIDPALGMARDWDLMSLTLLAPMLLILRSHGKATVRMSGKVILAYSIFCAFCTISYVAANIRAPASEKRFYSLLEYYGIKDETGWAIFAYYYLNNDEYDRAMELAKFMEKESIRLDKTYHILAVLNKKKGHLQEAEHYYELALNLKPFNPRLRNELGQVYLAQGRNEKALRMLKEARRIDPSLTFIAEGVGLAYFRLGHFDSASFVADTLFMGDKNSPGGHLICMVIAISSGDYGTAKHHYQEYLKYGSHRSDYEDIREHYSYLLQ
jgi:hypothetical protein